MSIPASAQVGILLKVTVAYTAIEDDGSSAVLTVEFHPGNGACVDNPYTTTVSGLFLEQGASVTGTGTKAFSLPTVGARPGMYRFCAWLTSQAGDILLAGPSVANLTLTPAATNTEQSWLGQTSQHQRFGLGTFGQAVIGFNYPKMRLLCTSTHPPTPWVDWNGFAEQLSIRIDTHGHFSGLVKTGNGNAASITGTFSGNRVTGSLTNILRPTLATGITLNTPPERHVIGGVCRATVRFTATRTRS